MPLPPGSRSSIRSAAGRQTRIFRWPGLPRLGKDGLQFCVLMVKRGGVTLTADGDLLESLSQAFHYP